MSTKQEKRNFYAFMLQGVIFFIGYCFVDVNTVIPLFIEQLTGRVELAGIAVTIRQLSTMLFQLMVGGLIVKIKNVPRYICAFLFLSYLAPLALCAPLGLGLGGMPMAMLTFAVIAVMWISDGFMVIGYYDLLGRTTSGANRARVLGYQQLFGGAGAIIGAFAVKKLLDIKSIAFNHKFAVIFAIGSAILVCGACCMLFVKDVPHRQAKSTYSLKHELSQMLVCVRANKGFRLLLLCQVFFTVSCMVAPFVLLMCESTGRVSGEFVSTLLNLQVVGTLLGGAVSAFLAPKRGNMLVCVVYCALSVLCGGFGLLASLKIGFVSIAMVITALTAGISYAAWAGFTNAILDFADIKNAHSFLLANSALSIPLSLSALAAGQLVKYFGYPFLFGCAAILAIIGFAIAVYVYKIYGKGRVKANG